MRWKAYLALAFAAGCGSLGGDSASDNVPSTGVIGWRKLPQQPGTSSIQEPHVLCSGGNSFSAPSAIRRADGSFLMFYVTPAGAIGSATGEDGIYDWSDRGLAVLPSPGPWSEVSIAEDGADLLLAASARDGSRIEFFRSTDGIVWSASGSLVASEAWQQGSIGGADLLRDGQSWIVLFDAAGRTAIGRADSSDGSTWTADPAPLFTAGDVRAAGWPIVEIASPGAGLDVTRPGSPLYKMWFSGRALHGAFPFDADWSVGFAGSFDGAAWTIYAGNPVLAQQNIDAPGFPTRFADESAASVIALDDDEYFMYFEQPFEDAAAGTTRPCVALAIIP